MSKPPFKICDRVVCVDASDTVLALHGVYVLSDATTSAHAQVVWVCGNDTCYCASRFIHEQDTPCPSLADDYPDSPEDYEHNKPHHVIVWGAASLLIWLAFFAGLWCGWAWL